jgi:DNA-binding NarL/FixJ family response regulator
MALVIARDLSLPSIPSSQMLADLFNLSAGEAAVAAALLGGATAENVAKARQVSPDTVGRQIQSVLHKTEATNLRDFERMAASLTLMQGA